MTKIILLIEDQAKFAQSVKEHFELYDYTVLLASEPNEGLRIAWSEHIDAIILDIKFPANNMIQDNTESPLFETPMPEIADLRQRQAEEDGRPPNESEQPGWLALKALRANEKTRHTPIIVCSITAVDLLKRIQGYRLRATYMLPKGTKEFSLFELQALAERAIDEQRSQNEDEATVEGPRGPLDFIGSRVWINYERTDIILTEDQEKYMEILCKRPIRVVKYNEFAAATKGSEDHDAIHHAVDRLREALDKVDGAGSKYIKNARGRGYYIDDQL